MRTPVIVEAMPGNLYRATGAGGLSVGLSAEGATATEAVNRLTEQVQRRVDGGATLTELNIEPEAPWKQDAGCLRDEPLFDAWRDAMQGYRQELDEDPEAL